MKWTKQCTLRQRRTYFTCLSAVSGLINQIWSRDSRTSNTKRVLKNIFIHIEGVGKHNGNCQEKVVDFEWPAAGPNHMLKILSGSHCPVSIV